MSVAGELFLDAVAKQGAELDEASVRSLHLPFAPGDDYPFHTFINRQHLAVMYARDSEATLNQPLNVHKLPAIGPFRFLGALLNTQFGQYPSQPDNIATFTTPSDRIDGICDGIEESWRRTLASPHNKRPPLVQVFTDENNIPIVMRKGRGAHPTGILLQPMWARMAAVDSENTTHIGRGEFRYPAGSIVQLNTARDDELLRSEEPDPDEPEDPAAEEHPDWQPRDMRKLWLPNGHSLVSPLSEISGLHFARLSALMYNHIDILHDQGYGPGDPVDEGSAETYWSQPLTRLRRLAHSVIRHAQKD